MTALDLSPAPAAARRGRAIWAQARMETVLLLRNGEQLLLACLIPVGVLLLGRFVGGAWIDLPALVGSVMAMALWSTAFTATAIATGFERRYGVLERLAASPLTPTGLLLGKGLSVVMVTAGQLLLLTGVALILGWRPMLLPAAGVTLLLTATLGMISFVALALLLAARLRAEATLALANVVHLVVVVGGGLVIPLSSYPPALGAMIGVLPTAAVGEAFRAATSGVTPAPWYVIVAAGWALVAFLVARRGFRWI